jgi:hypothetical protein
MSEIRVGFPITGTVTVNDCVALVPALVVTVTPWAPVPAVAPIVKLAVIWVALTTVTLAAVTPVPPIATVAPGRKLEPFKVTETFVPWVPVLGAIELRMGAAGGAVTVTVAVPTAEGETLLAA